MARHPPTRAEPELDPSAPCTPDQRLAQAQRESSAHLPSPPLRVEDVLRPRPTPPRREVLEQQILLLERLIAATDSNDPDFPHLLLRLATLFDNLGNRHDREAAAADSELRDAERTGHAEKTTMWSRTRDEHRTLANEAMVDAARIYRTLVTKPQFARYVRLDEALFRHGHTLGRLDREPQMREAYLRLIREFPNSAFIPVAYASFADDYRRRGQLREAATLYDKAVSRPDEHRVRTYALAQLGWCHLELGRSGESPHGDDVDRSIDAFVKAIELLLHDERDTVVLQDAQRGLTEAYVLAGNPHRAWAFFERTIHGGTDRLRSLTEALAHAYFRERRYRDSTVVLRDLQARHPDDPRACEWQWRIFLNSLADDDALRPVQERVELLSLRAHLDATAANTTQALQCRDRARDAQRVLLGVDHVPMGDGPLVVPSTEL